MYTFKQLVSLLSRELISEELLINHYANLNKSEITLTFLCDIIFFSHEFGNINIIVHLKLFYFIACKLDWSILFDETVSFKNPASHSDAGFGISINFGFCIFIFTFPRKFCIVVLLFLFPRHLYVCDRKFDFQMTVIMSSLFLLLLLSLILPFLFPTYWRGFWLSFYFYQGDGSLIIDELK